MPSTPGVSRAPAGNAWMFRHGIPTPVEEVEFSTGIVRDLPRHMIPSGGAYEISDFLPDLPGKLYKRGATIKASDPIGSGFVGYVAVAEADFENANKLYAIATTGSSQSLFDVTGVGSVDLGVIDRQPMENPPFVQFDQTLSPSYMVFTDGYKTPSVVPKKVVQAGTISDLSADAPPARYSCVVGGTLVLGNSTDHPNRIWFSFPGDGTNWTDGGVVNENWLDTRAEVTGLATIAGSLLVFHRDSVERVIEGSLGWEGWAFTDATKETKGPPSTVQLTGLPGCMDARSIAYANGYVYFAHESGIYYTNGAAGTSLVTKSQGIGISRYWRELVKGFDKSLGAVVALGIFSDDWLFVTVRHQDGTTVQMICYLPMESWVHTSPNIGCDMYTLRHAPTSAIFGAPCSPGAPTFIIELSTLFGDPGAAIDDPANRFDFDGNPVLPYLETRMLGGGLSLKRYHDGFLNYYLRDTGEHPSLEVMLSTGLEAEGGFTDVVESPMSPVLKVHRQRFTISKDVNGIHLAIAQAGASGRTEIYGLETTFYTYYVADGL